MKIFSGDDSKKMWTDINDSKTKEDLKWALYGVCCRLQEFESKMDRRYWKAVSEKCADKQTRPLGFKETTVYRKAQNVVTWLRNAIEIKHGEDKANKQLPDGIDIEEIKLIDLVRIAEEYGIDIKIKFRQAKED